MIRSAIRMVVSLAAVSSAGAGPAIARSVTVFIGTQEEGPGKGILATTFDEKIGQLAPAKLAAPIDRPTWLVVGPRRHLYAVRAVGFDGSRDGAAVEFALGRDAADLRPVSEMPAGGGGTTHLALDPVNRLLAVANYSSGSVRLGALNTRKRAIEVAATYSFEGTGPHSRQDRSHPHGVAFDPSGRFLAVADLGTDRVFLLRVSRQGRRVSLAPHSPLILPAGAGPRHLTFSRDGRFLYLVTELSADVFIYRWNAREGSGLLVQRQPLDPSGRVGKRSGAEILLAADGRHLYVTNRGTDEIQVFGVDPRTGGVAEVQRIASGGRAPWTLAIVPGGRWMLVANQASDAISVFAIEAGTGRLSPTGRHLEVPRPVAIAIAR